jgi:hypothetical protein
MRLVRLGILKKNSGGGHSWLHMHCYCVFLIIN